VPEALCSFEPKLDGWRALVYIDGKLRVRTRTGRDITAQPPELLAPLADVVGGGAVG
jgi:ATP-dependent DNA ligase